MPFNRSAFGQELFRGVMRMTTGEDPVERMLKRQKALQDKLSMQRKMEMEEENLRLRGEEIEIRKLNALKEEQEDKPFGYESVRAQDEAKHKMKMKEIGAQTIRDVTKQGAMGERQERVAKIKGGFSLTKTKMDITSKEKIHEKKLEFSKDKFIKTHKLEVEKSGDLQEKWKSQHSLNERKAAIEAQKAESQKEISTAKLALEESKLEESRLGRQLRLLEFELKRASGEGKQELEAQKLEIENRKLELGTQKVEVESRLKNSQSALNEQEHELVKIGKDSNTLDRKYRESRDEKNRQIKLLGFDVEFEKQRRTQAHSTIEKSKDRGFKAHMKAIDEHGRNYRMRSRFDHATGERVEAQKYKDAVWLKERSVDALKIQEELQTLIIQRKTAEENLKQLKGGTGIRSQELRVRQADANNKQLTSLISAKQALLREVETIQGKQPTVAQINGVVKTALSAHNAAKELVMTDFKWREYAEKVEAASKPTEGGLFGHSQESAKAAQTQWLNQNPDFKLKLQEMLKTQKELDKWEGIREEYTSGKRKMEIPEEINAKLQTLNLAIETAIETSTSSTGINKKIKAMKEDDPDATNTALLRHSDPRVQKMADAEMADAINTMYSNNQGSKRIEKYLREVLLTSPNLVEQLIDELPRVHEDLKPLITSIIQDIKGE